MDGAMLIAELAKALAWPTATIGIVLVLRKSIAKLLEGLRSVRYREFEARFDEGLKVVRGERPPPAAPPVQPMAPSAPAALAASEDAQDLLQHAPDGAIFAAWAGVERALLDAAKEVGTPSVGSAQATAYNLRELKALEPATFASIRGLQHLRNLVVHGGSDVRERLGIDRAREFVAMAEAVQFSIEQNVQEYLKRKPKS